MTRSAERPVGGDDAPPVVVNIDGLEELSAIRELLDTIRECFDWWLKNHRREQWLPVQPITTIPFNPTTQDSADRAKTFTADKPADNAVSNQPQRPPTVETAKTTTPAEGLDDETQFCCAAPDLRWTGHPQFPGVACQSCGYIVADCGSVVMQPALQADPNPEPKEQQRPLFAEE